MFNKNGSYKKIFLSDSHIYVTEPRITRVKSHKMISERWCYKWQVLPLETGTSLWFLGFPLFLLVLSLIVALKWRSFHWYLSQLMRWWHFSSSVNSFFKHACAAIQWGKMSDFWSDSSSTSILHVCEQRRLGRDCVDAQARLSLRWLPMW